MKNISIHSGRSFQGPSINATDRTRESTAETKQRDKNKSQHASNKSNTIRSRDHVATEQLTNRKPDDATEQIDRQINQNKLQQAANQRQIDAALKKLDKQNNPITATDPKPINNDTLIEKASQEATETTTNTITNATTLAENIRSSVNDVSQTSVSALSDQTAKPSIDNTSSVDPKVGDPLAIENPESASDSSSDPFSHDIFFIGRHTATSVTNLIDNSTKRSVAFKEADSDRKQDFFTFKNLQSKDKDDNKRLPQMFDLQV